MLFDNKNVLIVRSIKGRDIGRHYVVVDEDKDFYYLSDGAKRGLDLLKKKRKTHTKYCEKISQEYAIWNNDTPKRPIEVKNAEIRKVIVNWKEKNEVKECQKKM